MGEGERREGGRERERKDEREGGREREDRKTHKGEMETGRENAHKCQSFSMLALCSSSVYVTSQFQTLGWL